MWLAAPFCADCWPWIAWAWLCVQEDTLDDLEKLAAQDLRRTVYTLEVRRIR